MSINQTQTSPIGQATLSPTPNAAPPHRKSEAPKRKTWFRRSVDALVGIDIDVDEVRVATLCPNSSDQGALRWRNWYRYPLPAPVEEAPTKQWLDSVLDRIESGLPRCIDGDNNLAAISLPIPWTHYQTIAGLELDEVRQRYHSMFSGSVFQSTSHLSHWPIVGTHHGLPSSDDQYVVAAAAEQTTCEICERVTRAGFKVQSVLPHAISLAHAAQDLTAIQAQAVLWLSKGAVLIAVLHQSGVGLARTLAPIPEKLLETEKSGRKLDVYTLRPYLSMLAEEIQSTLKFASRADMSQPSDAPLLLCGPLAELSGIDEALATLSRKPVAAWQYAGRSRPVQTAINRNNYHARIDPAFANALSLALAAGRTGPKGYCQ